jgi:hypothetical protein
VNYVRLQHNKASTPINWPVKLISSFCPDDNMLVSSVFKANVSVGKRHLRVFLSPTNNPDKQETTTPRKPNGLMEPTLLAEVSITN